MKKIYEMPASVIIRATSAGTILAGTEPGQISEYQGNENNIFDSQAKDFSESFNPDAKSLWED